MGIRSYYPRNPTTRLWDPDSASRRRPCLPDAALQCDARQPSTRARRSLQSRPHSVAEHRPRHGGELSHEWSPGALSAFSQASPAHPWPSLSQSASGTYCHHGSSRPAVQAQSLDDALKGAGRSPSAHIMPPRASRLRHPVLPPLIASIRRPWAFCSKYHKPQDMSTQCLSAKSRPPSAKQHDLER